MSSTTRIAKKYAKFVRRFITKETGLDWASVDSCNNEIAHEWCYDCMNDIIEQIAIAIEVGYTSWDHKKQ